VSFYYAITGAEHLRQFYSCIRGKINFNLHKIYFSQISLFKFFLALFLPPGRGQQSVIVFIIFSLNPSSFLYLLLNQFFSFICKSFYENLPSAYLHLTIYATCYQSNIYCLGKFKCTLFDLHSGAPFIGH